MKLSDHLEKSTVAEFELTDGTVISINVPEATHRLEYLDDEAAQLGFITLVTTGRRKGQKALRIVPYHAVHSVTIVG